ncbi:MAG: amidohydrolase family protein [Acidobacteria bacterium]|nr:amidohydrolase family protein [Acidobacteriota bacterium]
MKILTADHVLPITSEPINYGAIAIDATDIVAVGPFDDIKAQFDNAEVTEFGKAAILPGFVNCHSHLEITAMRGRLDEVEHDFRAWLLRLNDLRAAMSDEEIEEAAFLGAVEGREAGVTCFGDIGRSGHAGLRAMKRAGLRGIVFQETEFSPDNRTAEDDFKKLNAKFESLRGEATNLVTVGLSPHAPYTVGSMLFEMIAQFSIINRVPITIHAAESANETELMTRGTGFFTEVYERFGVEWVSPHCTTIEYLERLGVLSARPLLAHCVDVTDRDIERIAANGARIAHCPKSNAKFGHGFAPFERFLDAGIAVGLGSDSVASNNLCDILEESRFASLVARNRPGSERFIGPGEMLRAATLGGAEALGLEDKIGSLEPGKKADLAVVSLDAAAQNPIGDIEAALVFSSSGRDTLATYVNGEPIYSRRP